MKLAFSTLGCPNWTWNEIVSTAKDLGMNGIEVRGVYNDLNSYDSPTFQKANIETTTSKLKNLGLEICIFSSSAVISDQKRIDEYMNETGRYVTLAAETGAKYVRVLGDRSPEPKDEVDDEYVIFRLKKLCVFAEKYDVTLLIETNGAYADTSRLAKLIESTGKPNAGILWDVHHPYRFMNEPVSDSYMNVRKYLKHVHVKDSVMRDGKTVYKIPGHGDVPLEKCVRLLRDSEYEGYISLEWVKRWNEELEDPGIVFSNFVNFMRSIK